MQPLLAALLLLDFLFPLHFLLGLELPFCFWIFITHGSGDCSFRLMTRMATAGIRQRGMMDSCKSRFGCTIFPMKNPFQRMAGTGSVHAK